MDDLRLGIRDPIRSADRVNRHFENSTEVRRSPPPGLMAFNAASPRCMASSLSNSVMPNPLPVSRSACVSIFAPSRPGGVSLDSTSLRTIPIA